MPILVSVRAETNAQAASLISVILAGQIIAALISARFRFDRLSRPVITGIFALYAVALLASLWADSWILFASCWFLVGLACGFLMQFGIVTAATSSMKLQAFAFRLSGALLFSGLMAVSMLQLGQGPAYHPLIAVFCVTLAIVFLTGMFFWTNGISQAGPTAVPRKNRLTSVDAAGLSLLFLFFAGQIGFHANSAHFTALNQLDLSATSIAIALSKILISIVILFIVLRKGSRDTLGHQLAYSFALAIALALIFSQGTLGLVISAFVAFELFLNLTSAAFMASLSERFTDRAKSLILIFTLFGALAGSPAAGFLIDHQMPSSTLTLAIGTAFLPLVWQAYWRNRP